MLRSPLTPDVRQERDIYHVLILATVAVFASACSAPPAIHQDSVTPIEPRQSTTAAVIEPLVDPDDAAEVEKSPVQVSQYIRRMFEDRHGNLWFGTNGDGVCRYDGTTFVYFTTKDGLGGNTVRGIVEDEDGVFWFATDGGLSRYDGKFFTVFREKDGLSHRDLWSLQKDSSGNLWVGTMAGVCRYDGKCFSRFPLPLLRTGHHSRFTPELVWSIYEDGARRLWFGTDGTGVVEYGARSVVAYTTRDGLCSDNVCSILQDRQRNLWFGTWDGGVSRYDGSSFTTFLAPVGAAGHAIWTMLEDRAGRLWFGTSGGGVYRYDGTAFRHFSANDGLGNQHVQSILEDRRGRLWFGTSGGVYRFDGARFLNFTRDGRGDAKAGTLGGGPRMEGNPTALRGQGVLFHRRRSRRLPAALQRVALRKLVLLDAADSRADLCVPPGNRLEPLEGDRAGQHGSRINDQRRVCFVWRVADAFDVEIVDSHSQVTAMAELTPIHPGEVLRAEFLEPHALSQRRLAEDVRVPARRVDEIVLGKRGITADTALRLSRYFGTSERFWLNLQVRFDLETERDRAGARIAREVPVPFKAV